jgi:hypothetical protein
MNQSKWKSLARISPTVGLVLWVLLGACGSGEVADPSHTEQMTLETVQAAATEAGSNVAEPPETSGIETPTSVPATSTPLPTETAVPTPTEDTRLPPEEWRSWPIVPTLSPSMEEIYRLGAEMGNDPHHFSKVGDCQSIPTVFMGWYDGPGCCSFSERYAHLQETVDHFAGSFDRYGYALHGGFNFPTLFSPLRADPSVCLPGETPLECEYRNHRPSFAIISLETWYEGRTSENYEVYLRRTVDLALSRGIVPILATKADNVEGNHSINLATARIAYEYDVPLWNFWLAAQYLPGHGIDWDRDSRGFHITIEAWGERSFTALKTLDALWRAASGLAPID